MFRVWSKMRSPDAMLGRRDGSCGEEGYGKTAMIERESECEGRGRGQKNCDNGEYAVTIKRGLSGWNHVKACGRRSMYLSKRSCT